MEKTERRIDTLTRKHGHRAGFSVWVDDEAPDDVEVILVEWTDGSDTVQLWHAWAGEHYGGAEPDRELVIGYAREHAKTAASVR